MRVSIGLVMTKGVPVPPDFVKSWTRMLQVILTGEGNKLLPAHRQVTELNVIYDEDFPIDFARNEICRLFLDKDPTSEALVFLDIDMTHPPDLVHRLLAHEVDVVTARYVLRKPPYFSVAMRRMGPERGDYQAVEKLLPLEAVTGLLPIDAGGAGALLVSRDALALVRERVGNDWFRYQDGPVGKRSVSEDMWFYEQAKACGLQAYLDADCWCGHERREFVGPKDHLPYHEALTRALRDEVPA